MTAMERHLVWLDREIEGSDQSLLIEVEVHVRRGYAGDYWQPPDGDEAEIIESSHPLTDAEREEAMEKAVDNPTPEPEEEPDKEPEPDWENVPF